MLPPLGAAKVTTQTAKAPTDVIKISFSFVRMVGTPSSPSNSTIRPLLFNSRTCGSARDPAGGNLLGALFRGLPQREFGALVRHLQSAQEVHKVPRFFRLDHVRERRHRSSVQASHEYLVEVPVGDAAFKPRPDGKVVRTDRIIVAIGERRGRRAIAAALLAVAFPAFQLLKQFLAVLNALDGELGLGRNVNGITGLFVFPAWRERFDEGY